MDIEVTDEAREVLARSLEMGAGRATGVRLRTARGLGGGSEVQIELADGPLEGETTIQDRDLTLYVSAGVAELFPNAVVVVEPQHETVVVRAK